MYCSVEYKFNKMRKILFVRNLYILLFLFFWSCSENKVVLITEYEIPTRNHDLSYIPYNAKLDNSDYIICDSTGIGSGRSRVRYISGTNKFKEVITTNYLSKPGYKSFNGYIVIRFLVNCEGKAGRYRAQSLNLDFSPLNAPSDLLDYSVELVEKWDNWTRTTGNDNKKEYSKFINLKIKNGEIQHVLL